MRTPDEIENNEFKSQEKAGFWKRQFQADATRQQKAFDWFLGVILPVGCVIADPLVFKGGLMTGDPLLGGYKSFAYLLSFTSIMAMMAWLIWREKLKGLNAVLSGLFALGGIVSIGIGIVLFPFSVLGLVVIIGLLGFTPLFAGFVYIRNSFRAFQQAKPFLEKRLLVSLLWFSALLSGTVPFAVNVEIDRRIDNMIQGNAEHIEANAGRLAYYSPLVDFSRIRYASCRSSDDAKRRALADVYIRYQGGSDRSTDFGICGRD